MSEIEFTIYNPHTGEIETSRGGRLVVNSELDKSLRILDDILYRKHTIKLFINPNKEIHKRCHNFNINKFVYTLSCKCPVGRYRVNEVITIVTDMMKYLSITPEYNIYESMSGTTAIDGAYFQRRKDFDDLGLFSFDFTIPHFYNTEKTNTFSSNSYYRLSLI
jgi:hypothetical protein